MMLALSEYPSKKESFDAFLKKSIHSAMENTVNSQLYSDRIGKHLADRLNQLDNATNKLSELLGRVPEVKELAEEMGISEDEVSILLKTSLDTLSVNE